jgi:hypothetical protein
MKKKISKKGTKSKKTAGGDAAPPAPQAPPSVASVPVLDGGDDARLNLHLYVIHSAVLASRENNYVALVRALSNNPRINLHASVVSPHDPKDITQSDVQQLVNLGKFADGSPWNAHITNMHVNQVSNALKHLRALTAISQAEAQERALHLVVEDDVLYPSDVDAKLLKLARELDRAHGVTCLGLPGRPTDSDAFQFVPALTMLPMLPCCESYVVSPEAAKRLLPNYLPIRFTANKQLTYAAAMADLAIQQSVPNIFSDGSKVGRFCSSLTPNSGLIFNQVWVAAWQLLQRKDVTKEEYAAVEDALANSDIEGHPDMLHMRARMVQKQGRYEEANALFARADAAYSANQAIVNNESEFLAAYIDNSKYLQDAP